MNSTDRDAPLPPVHTVILGDSSSASRPTVVMLHGWQKSIAALRPLGELLAERCKVVLVDLPGFGDSPLPHAASNEGGGWSTIEYAERVREILSDLGVTEAVFVGHSFGGRISVRMAKRWPTLVKAVVLVASHGIPTTQTPMKKLRSKAIRLLVKATKGIDSIFGTHLFQKHVSPRFGSTDYNAAGDLRRTLVKTVTEDLSSEALDVKAPTLLLWGAEDRVTPLEIAHSYNRLIHNTELYTFPNKGHEPYSDVGSHLLATYIERFLASKGILA